MKKLALFLVFALLATSAYAEISAKMYSGNSTMLSKEQTVYINAYNNSGTDIAASSYAVVVLDTAYTTANQASGAVGTYFTSTTSAGNAVVLGVTEGAIANGQVGKVVVRGPAKVDLLTADTTSYAAGATITTTTTAFYGINGNGFDTTAGASAGVVIGTLIAPSGDRYPESVRNAADGGAWESDSNVWWAWIGKQ